MQNFTEDIKEPDFTEEDIKESEVIGRLGRNHCDYNTSYTDCENSAFVRVLAPGGVYWFCCKKCFIESFAQWDDGCKFTLLNGKEFHLECLQERKKNKQELINGKYRLMLSRPSGK